MHQFVNSFYLVTNYRVLEIFNFMIKEKQDPFPSTLSTMRLPPIRDINSLQMESPNPVPPNFLVVVESACVNG